MEADILIRGPHSTVRVVDGETKAVSENLIYTRDVFDIITRLSTGDDQVLRESWFGITGNNYSAIRYLLEGKATSFAIIEASPQRIIFKAEFGSDHGFMFDDQKKKLLNYTYSRGLVRFETVIDLPYIVMGLTLRPASTGGRMHVSSSTLGFAVNSILTPDSEIWSMSMPNLHANGEAHEDCVLPEICWGTTFARETATVDYNGIVQFPKMFFDSLFNDHLVLSSWFSSVLPNLATSTDSPFKPFELSNLNGVSLGRARVYQSSIRALIDAHKYRFRNN